MITIRLLAICLITLFSNGALASVFETASIKTENRSPFVSLYGLARADYEPHIGKGSVRLRSQIEVANYLSKGDKNGEAFFIDGETWIFTQSALFQSEQYYLNIDVPFIHHGRGVLDRSIYNFHDLFGMPQNGRVDDQHDQQLWVLRGRSGEEYQFDTVENSLGDISIAIGTYVDEGQQEQLALSLTLPTGDFDTQSGNETVNIGLSYASGNPLWLSNRTWLNSQNLSFWWGASLNFLPELSGLSMLEQNHWVATGRVGIAWVPFEQWVLKAQLDTNTPLFDSDIRELGWIPVQTSVALQHVISTNHSFDLGIVEDLRPRATPDVVFTMAYEFTF